MLTSNLLSSQRPAFTLMVGLLLTMLSATHPTQIMAADRVWTNPSAGSLTLTADAATATNGAYYVSAGSALAVGDALVADSTAAGLTQNTVYYVVGVLTDGLNFTNVLSATSGGVAMTNTATVGQTVTCTAAFVWAANWDAVPVADDNAWFLAGYTGKAVNLREAATIGSLNFSASGSELNLFSSTNGTSSLSPLVFSTTSGTPAITNWTTSVMRLGMEDATYHNGTLKINGSQGLLFDGMNASGALRLEKIDWSGFSGGITVQEGLIDLYYNNGLIGTSGSTAQDVTLGNGASANLSGLKVQQNQAVNALNGTETARVFGGGTLTVGYNNGSGVYNGLVGQDLADALSFVSLTKTGNGTLVLSSNANISTLSVNNGSLVLGGGVSSNSTLIAVGNVANSTNATLIVTNSTIWANTAGSDPYVGGAAGVVGSVLKLGQGSYWDLGNKNLRVGQGAGLVTNNTLLVTDGAILTNCFRIFMADNAAHAGNKVIVSNNAVAYLNQGLYVGQASRTITNQLYIMNGGKVYANLTTPTDAGMGNAGFGSLTMISGNGSLLDFNGKQYKCGGNVGTNNGLYVINGSVITNVWGPAIGDNGAAVGNFMIISNGGAYYGASTSPLYTGAGGNSVSNYLQIGGLGAPSFGFSQGLKSSHAAGANYNTVIITNATWQIYNSGGYVSVGNQSSGNLGTNNVLIVQQGGLLDVNGKTMTVTASHTNSIIIDGGIVTNLGSTVLIDKTGNGNQIVVKNGGKVYQLNTGGNLYLANSVSQLNPAVTITDSGSLWDCAGYTFNVGKKSDSSNMTNHTLTVANNAVLTNGSILVSQGGTSVNNKLVVNGGKVYANILTVNAGGTVQLTGGSSDLLQVDSITGAGSLVVTGAAVTASSVVVGWTNGSSTLGPKLTGNLTLTKVGLGNVTLSGAENYSGATKVNEGSLTVPPSYAGNSAFTVAAGATLIPSTSTSSNSAQMASLALDNGSTLIFASLPVNTNAPVTAGVLAPTNTVTITASGAYAVGTYDLIKYTTLGGNGVGAFALTPRPGVTAYLTNNTATTPKKIQLVITAVTPEIWKGQVSTNWDIAITQNWQTNGVDAFYYDLSAVQFDDTRVNVSPLVNLTANVQASAVTVSNVTKDYVLATENSSAMSGLGGLTKKGSGTLTIANMNNTFSGNVAIDAGNVVLASATLGNGSIANNGGLTFDGTQSVLNTISGTGSVTNTSGTTTLGVNNSYTGGTTLNGGSIVLNSGTTNAFGSGVVRLNNNAAIAVKPANIPGGSGWNAYGSVYIGNSLVVQAGQTNLIENTGSVNFGNLWLGGTNYGGVYPTWTGSGTLKFQNNSPTAVITAILWMGNILQNFNGTIELGTTVPGNRMLNLMGHTGIDGPGGAFGVGPFAVTNFNASQTAWVLDGDGTGYTDNRANDWVSVCQLGSISAVNSITGLQGAKSNATTFVVGALNTDTVYAGFISNNAAGGLTSLTKVGTGKLTLSGFGNGYTGSTIVSNGTLVISGSQGGMFGLGAGDFTVAGGKLEITGSLMVSNAVNVNSGTLSGIGTITGSVTNFGGTIYPGLDGTGILYFNNSLTFAAPAMTKIVVADGVVSNLVSVTGQLSPNGSTVLIDTAGQVLNDSTNTIITYSGGNNATAFNLSFITPQTGKAVSLVDSGSTIDLVVTTSSAPTPEPISANYDSNTGQLTLTWTQPGWTLEAQTNSLSNGLSPSGWSTVSGAASPYVITVSPTAPTVFYRLKY